jgi:hypothetical protein
MVAQEAATGRFSAGESGVVCASSCPKIQELIATLSPLEARIGHEEEHDGLISSRLGLRIHGGLDTFDRAMVREEVSHAMFQRGQSRLVQNPLATRTFP